MWSLLVRPEQKQPYHRASHCRPTAPALDNGAAATRAPQLLLLELHPAGCLGAMGARLLAGCTAAPFARASNPWHMLAFQQKPTWRHDGKHSTVEHHSSGLFRRGHTHPRGNLLMITEITSNPLFCSSYILGSRKRSDPLNPAAVAWHPKPNSRYLICGFDFCIYSYIKSRPKS